MSEPRIVSKGDTITMTEVAVLSDDNGYLWLVNERVGIRVMVRHGLRFIYAPGVIPKDGVILTEGPSAVPTPSNDAPASRLARMETQMADPAGPADAEAIRALALSEACFIAADVGELGERMTSPFREGVETAVEEIIHRLMEAGAPQLADNDESRAIRARFNALASERPSAVPTPSNDARLAPLPPEAGPRDEGARLAVSEHVECDALISKRNKEVAALRAEVARLWSVVEIARVALTTADDFLSDFDGGGQRRDALNDTLDALEAALNTLALTAGATSGASASETSDAGVDALTDALTAHLAEAPDSAPVTVGLGLLRRLSAVGGAAKRLADRVAVYNPFDPVQYEAVKALVIEIRDLTRAAGAARPPGAIERAPGDKPTCPPHAFPNFGRANCKDCGISPASLAAPRPPHPEGE